MGERESGEVGIGELAVEDGQRWERETGVDVSDVDLS